MNLFNTQMQLPIVPTNPKSLKGIKQQCNQELTFAENRNYISIIPCLFKAIVSEYSDKLLPIDIIYFFQILNLYSSALSKNEEEIIYSSEKLAKILGYANKEASNMRSTILCITKKLEQAEFLKVHRSKNKNGTDKVNKIVPILPDRLYEKIKYEASNSNVDSKRLTNESNLQHIIRTKLFVPITLTFIQNLFKDSITPKHKLFYLNCIITAYKNYQITGQFSFADTSQELMKANNISRGTLTKILAYIRKQESDFFIKVKHTYTKSDDIDSNRYDKSIFVISINHLVIPYSFIKNTDNKVALEFSDTKCLDVENETIKPYTYEGSQAACLKTMPSMLKNNAYNNKDIIIKNKYNRNIDYIDANCKNSSISCSSSTLTSEQNYKEEFLEDKLCLSSSKSYNNSFTGSAGSQQQNSEVLKFTQPCSNKNPEVATRVIKDISEYKELRHFYPLSEKDIRTLNSRANREFSNNFVNQLLLKLYIKYPEKRFKNKFTFLSYMVQILKNEKHQGPLVNHTTFRFSCNINTKEKEMLEYEKYLSEIENSFDISKEMQVRKKIAGRYSTNVAYKMLTQVEFKINHDNSFITALIPSNLDLSKRQIEILKEQLEAVYGISKYYVQELEDEECDEDGRSNGNEVKETKKIQYPKTTKPAIVSNSMTAGILTSSSDKDTTDENIAWNQPLSSER